MNLVQRPHLVARCEIERREGRRAVLEELFHARVMTVQPQPRPEIAIFSDRIPSHVGVEVPGDDDIGQRRQIIQAFAEFFQSLDS